MNASHHRNSASRLTLKAGSILIVALLLLGAAARPAQAAGATWTVNPSTADDTRCNVSERLCRTIGAAVGAANSGDTLSLAAGTYSIAANGESFPIAVTKSLTFSGASAATTVVDATNANQRVFQLSGAGASVTFENLTLRNGSKPSENGGAILANGIGALTLQGVILRNNVAYNGGAVAMDAGVLTVNSSTFTSNSAQVYGGAIYTSGGLPGMDLAVTASTFTTNLAARGGAVSVSGTTGAITGGSLTSGSANLGAGVYVSDASLTLDGVTLHSNTASGSDGLGGAAYLASGSLTLTNSTLGNTTSSKHNVAVSGAGVYQAGGALTVRGTALVNNSASGAGGALALRGGTATITNATLSTNQASGGGAGLYNAGATATLNGVTVANNASGVWNQTGSLSATGLLLANNGSANCTGTVSNGGGNLESVSGASCSFPSATITLNALALNGGPTLNHALPKGSPAIDAGAGDLTVDQRGQPRPKGTARDAGAYEYAWPVITLDAGDLTFNEGDLPARVAPSATLEDDAGGYNNGALTFTLSSASAPDGLASDLLEIASGGDGNPITLSDTYVLYNGSVVVGTYAGGDGANALTVTLSSSATPAAVQALIRAVTFQNTSSNPNSDDRTLTVALNDGAGETSQAATRAIKVVGANLLPTVADFNKSLQEDGYLYFTAADFTAAFSDLDNDTLSKVKITNLAAHGKLALLGSYVSLNQEIPLVDLDDLTYTPDADYFGSDSFGWTASDSAGASNYAMEPATVSLSVAPVNDLPVLTDFSKSGSEDVELALSAADFTGHFDGKDTGDALTEVKIIRLPVQGELRLSGASVTLNQVITLANLDNLRYAGSPNANGLDTFQWNASDGLGFAAEPATASLTLAAINDAPSFTPGGAVTVNEDSGLYSAGWATAISTGAANESDQTLAFTVTNDNNALFAQQPALAADGTLTFAPTSDAHGEATVTVSLADSGSGTAPDDNTSDSLTFALTVNSVNDAPTLDAIGGVDGLTVAEDAAQQSVSLSGIGSGAANEAETISISATSSAPAIIPNPTVTYASPDGTGTLLYQPAADANGDVTITVRVTDSGSPAGVTEVPFVVHVTATNDAPVNSVPGAQTNAEDSLVTFSTASGKRISFADVDSASGQVTLSVAHGTLSLSQTTGLTFADGYGNGTAEIRASGTLADLNAALDGLVYTPAADYNGADTLTVTSSDSALSDSDTVALTLTPVNDAPVIGAPATQSVDEDTDLVFSSIAPSTNGLTISDVDALDADVLEAVLSSTNGILTLPAGYAVTITAGADASASMTLQGTKAQINAALEGLKFRAPQDYFGPASLSLTANDLGHNDSGTSDPRSATHTVAITVNPVNDHPLFSWVGGDPATVTVLEDSGARVVSDLITGITPGPTNESDQTVQFSVLNTNDTTALFSVQPSVDLDGTLTFTPAPNAYGSATLAVTLTDNGGAPDDFLSRPLTIAITAVNDGPSFTPGGTVTVNEDSGAFAQTWATQVSSGAENESGQNANLAFNVSVPADQQALFAVQPSITPVTDGETGAITGRLDFTPAADAYGSATVTVTLSDNGGTSDSGVETTAPQTFTITLNPVNDIPSFTPGADQAVNEDGGAQTVATWATLISKGPANESGQSLTFAIENDNPGLFAAQPAITAAGTLTYTPLANAYGVANLSVSLKDNGGVTNGGVDTTLAQTFTITLNPVNDAPAFTKGANQTVDEDSGLHEVAGWATVISKGPANEAGQALTFNVTGNTNASLFAAGGAPAIDPSGKLSYTLAENANGTTTITVTLSDDGGVTYGGVDTTAAQSFTITVTAINDAPTLETPGPLSTSEEIPLPISGAYPSDLDAGEADVQISLSVNHGTVTLGNVSAGLAFDSGADGSASMTITGTLNEIYMAVNNVEYLPDIDYVGSDTLALNLSDLGHTGAGGAKTASGTVNITVGQVNDAPVNTIPGAQTTAEDTALAFSSANGNALSVADVDSANLQVTLKALHGTLSLAQTTGLTFVEGYGSGTAEIRASGTKADLNAALATLSYTPAANYNGSGADADTLSVTTSDGALSDTDNVTITITPVNDQPTLDDPADQTVNEDAPATELTLTGVTPGPLNESGQTVNVTASSSDPSILPNPSATYDGGSSAWKLSFQPAANVFTETPVTVTVRVTDDDVTTPLFVEQQFTVTVNPVNDAPSFTKGADQTVDEDSGLHEVTGWATVISAGPENEAGQTLNFVVSNDNNSLFTTEGQPAVGADGKLAYTLAGNRFGTAVVTVALHDNGGAANGGVETSAAQTFNITINAVNDAPSFTLLGSQTVNEDSGAQTVSAFLSGATAGENEGETLTWEVTNDNAALFSAVPAINETSGDLTFTPADNANGSATVTVKATDSNATPLSTTQTFTITVTPVNDAPSFTKGADETPVEDSGAHSVPNWATLISKGPADESAQTLSFTVSVPTEQRSLFAVQPAVNASGTLSYTLAADAYGVATVTVSLKDSGGAANGGVDTSAAQSFNITINAVNDAPVNHVPGAQTTNEDTDLVFTGVTRVTISDDAGSEAVQVTLTTSHGVLTLPSLTGLTKVAGDNGTGSLTYSGTVSALNTALNSLRYTPTPNYNGTDSITLKTDDLGHPGINTPITDQDSIAVTVNAVNDAPVNSVPASPQTTLEDTALGLPVSLADVEASDLSVILNVLHGTLNLTQTSGLTFADGYGNGTAEIRASGAKADLNAALATLSYTPAANYNANTGGDSLTVFTSDLGVSGSGGAQTDADAVMLIITPVNDAPSFTLGAAPSVFEDAGAQNLAAWPQSVSAGPADESGQALTFTLTNDNNSLFAVQPAITVENALVFTPADNANGSATVSVTLTDDGGTLNAGDDTSETLSFTLTVTPVNDAPSFTPGADVGVLEDSGLKSVANWATGLTKGPANEDGQTLSFTVTNDNNSLFAAQPAIDASGALSFTPAASANGSATVSVTLKDDGLRENGGDDDSATLSFTLSVTAVNDAPDFTLGATPVAVAEDDNAQIFPAWISGITAGANEPDQVLTFTTTNDNNGLFAVQPEIAADGTLSFTPAADANGSATVSVKLSDDGDTLNAGDNETTKTFTLQIVAVNDAPVVSGPAAQSVAEDSDLVFDPAAATPNGLSLSDVDAGSDALQLALTATNGTLQVPEGAAGLITTGANGTAGLTLQGSLSELNAALNGMIFRGETNFAGAATLDLQVNDLGSSGDGGAKTGSHSVAITVEAVNDAPVNTAPASPQTTLEDTALGLPVSLADVEASDLSVILNVLHGTLNLTQTSGLTFADGYGNGTAEIRASGAKADLNAALATLSYTPAANYNGSDPNGDTLTVTSSDGELSDADSVTINITAVNDQPTLDDPADPAAVAEDSGEHTVSLSGIGSGALNENQTLTVTATSSDLNVVPNPTVLYTSPDATGSLSYTPVANASGSAVITVVVADNGDPARSIEQTFTITVNPVNDTPVLSLPAAQTTAEDTPRTFNEANLNAISLTDDSGAGNLKVTLTATNGVLSLGSTVDLSFTQGDGTDDASIIFEASLAQTQAALLGLRFNPTANFSGAGSVAVSVDDLGNTGSGGALTASGTIPVTVTAVNDDPVNTAPGAQTINEDEALIFSGAQRFWVNDVDAGSQTLQVTLTASNGSLTLPSVTGLTKVAGDNGTSSMTYSGTAAALNGALNNLTFTPNQHFNGSASVTILTDDLAHTGDGGAKTDSDSVAITVNAVNDAPTYSLPAAAENRTVAEGGTLIFSGASLVSIDDIDAAADDLSMTVSVQHGALTLATTEGFTVVNGNGTANVSMTGALSEINAALNGMTYQPSGDTNGTDGFAITIDDLAHNGGPANMVSGAMDLLVTPVNDAPVNHLPAAQVTNEDTLLTLSGANALSVSDVDAGTDEIEVSLTATHGAISLPGLAGLTFTAEGGDGTDDASMTFHGTLAAVNTALDGLTFRLESDYYSSGAGSEGSLRIVTSDLGFTGAGGAQLADDTLTIAITPVNDAPVFTKGADVTVLEDALAQTVAGWATGIGAGAANETQSLAFTVTNDNNSLFAAQPAIDASGALSFTPAANANGSATVSVTLKDDGLRENGGDDDSATLSFTLTVTAVNDAPSFTKGADVSVDEDSEPYAAAWATAISSGAANESGQALSFVVSVPVEQQALFSAQPAIAADGTLSFTPAADANGVATVTVQLVDDGSETAPDDNRSDAVSLTITINALNDAPLVSGPTAQSVAEDSDLLFDPAAATPNGLSLSDVDAGSDALELALTATNGTLQIPAGAVGLITTGANGTAGLTLQGSLSELNGALNGMIFRGDENFAGAATLELQVSDLGNHGAPGAQTSSHPVAITVTAVNDAPVNSVPASPQTMDEDTTLVFSSANGNLISVTDVDSTDVEVTLRVTHGVLVWGTVPSGVTVDSTIYAQDGIHTLKFTGPLSLVNQTLATLSYQPYANYNGEDTLTVTSSDTLLSDVDSATLTINPVNDQPTLDDPLNQTVDEDASATTLTLTGITPGPENESSQSVSVTAASSDASILPNPSVTYDEGTAAWKLSFQPAANAFTETPVTVTVRVTDNDVTPAFFEQQFTVTVNPINDAPSFTGGSNPTASEDSGAVTLAAWAKAISKGPANEASQTLAFTVTENSNPSLFAAQPAVNSSTGDLTFTPAANAYGYAAIKVTLSDNGGGADTSAAYAFIITVNPVNDPPSFTKGADQSVAEDAPAQTVANWATAIASGPLNEVSQQLNFIVTADPAALFEVQPAVSADGTLTYTPKPNVDGVATVSVQLHDDGGMALNGLDTSPAQTFTISIGAANDAPVNHLPGAQSTLEDHDLVFSAANANALSIEDDSAANPISAQISVTQGTLTLASDSGLTFSEGYGNGTADVRVSGTLANINAALNGLVYTPLAGMNGAVTLTLSVNDGGFTGGGEALTDSDTLTLTVTAVNDAPSFTKGADVSVDEDSEAYTAAWATAISRGAANESDQALSFVVSVPAAQQALFSAQPAIAADGTLSFTPAANAFGAATVTVQLVDDGGTASGGADRSAEQTFTITLNNVNDAPSFAKGADVSVSEDPGAQSIADWAKEISAGPNEGTAGVTFTVTIPAGKDSLFTELGKPAIDLSGALTFTLAKDMNTWNAGTSLDDPLTLSVSAQDAQGAVSAAQSFTLSVAPVNDTPVFAQPANRTMVTSSGTLTVNLTGIGTGAANETENVSLSAASNNQALIPDSSLSVGAVLDGAATLSLTPTVGQIGTAEITVTADDGQAANNTSARTFQVTVLETGILVDPAGNLTTTEAGGTATFNVSLVLAPTADVTIDLSSSKPEEGSVSPAQLTFTPADYATPQTVTITGVNDAVDDGNAAYEVRFVTASADPNYNARDIDPVSVSNSDDDTAGFGRAVTTPLITGEDGRSATFELYLLSQPVADVTVSLVSSDASEGQPSPASLTFTAANWSTHQTVTVSGVDDADVDGNINYTIQFNKSASSDPNYAEKSLPSIAAVNWDNDVVRTEITPATGGIVTMGDPDQGGATVTVPGNTVTSQVYMCLAPTSLSGGVPGLLWGQSAFTLSAHNVDGSPAPDPLQGRQITITVTYTDQQVDGLREDSLALYRSGTNGWEAASCGAPSLNPVANQLNVPVCQLGTFALFGAKDDYTVFLPTVIR